MHDYWDLIKKLAPLDRCHCGPDMRYAYELLAQHYSGTRLLEYPCGEKINHWVLPPYWTCAVGTLKGPDGQVIADKSRHHLELFTYAPKVSKKVSLSELQPHLLSDVQRPDATLFHFRNQYRHWAPEWGFSIPHRAREKLTEGLYEVEIESQFSNDDVLTQADLFHQGESQETFLFMGHFDHPGMVNDGLAGCIAAFELLKRLRQRKTYYSYRAFASVEIVGSVAYLHHQPEVREHVKEGVFLAFSGIDAPMHYQSSYHGTSRLDRIMKYFFKLEGKSDDCIKKHREVVGNDENIFDSVGIEIPMGTLCRWPFPQYHTPEDNLEIQSRFVWKKRLNTVCALLRFWKKIVRSSQNFQESLACLIRTLTCTSAQLPFQDVLVVSNCPKR